MSALEIVLVVLLSLANLAWIKNFAMVARTARRPQHRLRAEEFDGPVPDAPLLSVIVPARNEERNIGACLDALAATDYEPLEVVVVDDRSEDGTRGVVEAKGAAMGNVRIVDGEGPPPGWMGKVAAVWRGQAEARGEWLLFLDADVAITPTALRQCLHYVRDLGVDGVTVFGRLDNRSFWEWVVQPVVGGFVLAGNRPDRVNDPDRPDAMANGQFILVSREAYDAVGGHERLKGEVLDDVGFARLMKSNRRSLNLVFGRELFSCRMYDGLKEIWEGWSKNLFAGLHHSLWLALGIWLAVFVTALGPFIALAAQAARGLPLDVVTALSATSVALIYATYTYGLHAGRLPVRHAWSYPLGVVVLLGILANSALRISLGVGVTWKGRRLTDTGTGGRKVR